VLISLSWLQKKAQVTASFFSVWLEISVLLASNNSEAFSVLSEYLRSWISWFSLYVPRLILELAAICFEWGSALVITKLLRQQEVFWTTGLVTKEFWKADWGRCQIGFENPTIYSSEYAGAEIFMSNPCSTSEILTLDSDYLTLWKNK